MVDIESMKTTLLARRAELETRLDKIKHDVEEPLDHDFAEQAVELENGEVLSQIGLEAESEINKINRALIRMDEGIYGECVDCGASIPEARLKVRPYSSRCVQCAEAHEKA